MGGREMVLIANDITFANGTFGPLEDIVFAYVLQLERLSAQEDEGFHQIFLLVQAELEGPLYTPFFLNTPRNRNALASLRIQLK